MGKYTINNFNARVRAKAKIREEVQVPVPAVLAPNKAVLAIDPGMTTGLAWRMPDGQYLTAIATDTPEVWAEIRPEHLSLVIYENYAGKLISKYGLETVRVVGGVQALCMYHNIPLVRHVPQTRKAFVNAARAHIKATKNDTFVVHEVDALSHIFAYEYLTEGKRR